MPHDRFAAVVADRRFAEVDVGAEQLLAAEQEVPDVPLRVESDDVAAEQTAEHRLAHPRREHAPLVGLGPRNVREVVNEQVGPRRVHHLGHEIEVIVVHHHDAVRGHVVEVGDRAGEASVHRDVALDPRFPLARCDVGGERVVPEVVLDEPQQRVRDHGVESRGGRRGRCRHVHQARRRRRAARSANVRVRDETIVV